MPRQDLVVTKGEPRKIPYASRIRSFAACCGTHLFFEDSEDSETIDVTIASLDDPAPFAPQKAIFLEDKLPWVLIDESVPSFQTVPNKKPNDWFTARIFLHSCCFGWPRRSLLAAHLLKLAKQGVVLVFQVLASLLAGGLRLLLVAVSEVRLDQSLPSFAKSKAA
jgi:hypothetical protein